MRTRAIDRARDQHASLVITISQMVSPRALIQISKIIKKNSNKKS
jgi:hypothetical protein